MPDRICLWCKGNFTVSQSSDQRIFCSDECASKHHWLKNNSHQKSDIKICDECGKEYAKHGKISHSQWNNNRYCSLQCASMAKRIKDGMTKHERSGRKKVALKQKSPGWLDKIRLTTNDAMACPEIKQKLKSTRIPLTSEHKGKISTELMAKMLSNNRTSGKYGNVQNGTYICSKGDVYFRSKWEANYALYLDFLLQQHQIESWEYEVDTFLFEEIVTGIRSYTPDFKITYHDGSIEYHEIKGYMDSKSKTKLKRMIKYYPDVQIVLVDSEPYKEIIRKLKGVIKFY